MDDGWLGNIVKTFGLPVAGWAAFCALLVHWWRLKNERHRDRNTEKNGHWTQMQGLLDSMGAEIGRLGDRLKAVEAENEECRHNLSDVRNELADEKNARVRLEAYFEGIGQAEQHAQLIVSAERVKPDKPSNGGVDG